jgi:hypothetical protein
MSYRWLVRSRACLRCVCTLFCEYRVLVFCIALFCFVSLRFASCTQCCLCLWIVHSCLPLWFSLTFIRSASCTQCCLCLWIVHSCLPLWFSLTFIRSASCTQCCLCIWILYSCLSLRFSLTFIINVQLWIIMRILF